MKYSLAIIFALYLAIVMARFIPPVTIPSPLGGIVPHHLFVADIIQDFFSTLSTHSFDNIVVIGPNHEELGSEVITQNPVFDDQAITSLKPYIDNAFPGSKLTTYLLKHSISLSECASLAQKINKLDGNTIVVASIDFSHYLPSAQALLSDQIMLSKIESRDYPSILTMDSDYLDSPGSLVTLLQYLDLQGKTTMNILSHDNSGLRANPYAMTTSYYSMIFYGSNTQPSPTISSGITPKTVNESNNNLITLLFTGDVMLGRSVGYNIAHNLDPTWPFHYVAERLKNADITYINLENPLTSPCPLTQTGMIFCSDLASASGLQYAGVDIASLANNHATNYGPEGLASTISTLELYGINPVGLGNPVRIKRQGQVFSFLSLNDIGPYPGIDNVNISTLTDKVQQAKTADEVLIVSFHWGHEYTATPSSRQVSLAHQVIDAGADLVVGAHSHWVQTHEIYKDKPIYYSLGNFVFDQEWSPETKHGLAVLFTYQGQKLINTQELPVLIQNYGQPHWQ
jgi:poly-gamma-glutamate synthesis protein (capsule biosynthesis protein)